MDLHDHDAAECVKDVNGTRLPLIIGTFDVAIAGGTFCDVAEPGDERGGSHAERFGRCSDTTDFYKFTVGAISTVSIRDEICWPMRICCWWRCEQQWQCGESEILGFPNLLGALPETITTTLDAGTYYVWIYRRERSDFLLAGAHLAALAARRRRR